MRFMSSSDEHQSAGQHWYAELGSSAPLHQDLPSTTCAASIPGLPEPLEACSTYLDLQPKCHPHGPRWKGAQVHGVNEILVSS